MLGQRRPPPTDDAGAPVRRLSAEVVTRWPGQDARIKELIRRVQAECTPSSEGREAVLILLPIAYFALLCGTAAAVRWWHPAIPSWGAFLIGLALAQLLTRPLSSRLTRPNPDRLVSLITAEGLCPACGENFASLPRGSDHDLLTCPGCYARWRWSRVQRLAPFAADLTDDPFLARTPAGASGQHWPDAAGNPVPLVHPTLWSQRRAARPSSLRRIRLETARRRISGQSWLIRWPVAGFFFLFSLATAALWYVVARDAASIPPGATLSLGAASLVMFALGLWTLLGNFAYRPRRIVEGMLDEGLCPSCAADLPDPGAPGPQPCPNCHASWERPPAR